jgi:hypothetical protein
MAAIAALLNCKGRHSQLRFLQLALASWSQFFHTKDHEGIKAPWRMPTSLPFTIGVRFKQLRSIFVPS